MTTNARDDHGVARVRRSHRDGHRPKGYRHTLELIDDRTQQVLAVCDVTGFAVTTALEIRDDVGRTWHLRPNRKVLPTLWSLHDPDGRLVVEVHGRSLEKLANPFGRVAWSLRDAEGRETFRVVDGRDRALDRTLGGGPNEWLVTDGTRVTARVTRLPRNRTEPRGLLGRLRALLAVTDLGLVSEEAGHPFPGPVALALLMLVRELTDVDGAMA